MSLHVLAHHMASKGRGPDSMLVHMTPGEVKSLQKMAEKLGGSLTINPETGLPEAGFLDKLFKAALPMIAGFALGPAGFGLMGALGAGATVGGITALATGSLSKGLMAGLGAYGGAGLGEAFMNAGTNSLTTAGLGNYGDTLAAQQLEAGTQAYGDAASKLALESQAAASQAPMMEKLGAGFNAVTKDPAAMWDFAKANKNPLMASGLAFAAGQEPAKLDIPTTTQPAMIRPMHQTRERILPGDPDYRTNEAGSQIGYFRTKYTTPEPYLAASGGIVALADGGMTDEQLSSIGTYLATNPSASDLSAAMQQFGVSQADVDRARGQMAPASNAFTQAQSGNTVIPGAGEWWTTPEGGERYRQQQMEDYQKGVDSSNAFLKLRQATGQENTPFFSGTGSLSSGADSAAYLPAMYEQYGIEIPELAKTAYEKATGQAFQSGTTPTGFNAQSGQYTVGGAELPQVSSPVLGNGLTEYQQGIVSAGQGVQWGNPQSEAAFVENYYAGNNAYDLTQAERLLGLAPQTMTGALQTYALGIGRDKELAAKRAAGIDVSSSPYGGFSPARQIAENERNEGIRAGTIAAPPPSPAPAPSPFTVGGAQTNAPSGIERLTAQSSAQATPSSGQDLSGTVAGAFVGPNGTVITYDNNGRQTDTGKPASALNDYLTNPQESGVGSFVRGLSWGVSPEEDMKSSRKLYDYAKARGLSAFELLKQSGVEDPTVTAKGIEEQWAQWNVAPIKPTDPYKPGSPIVTPPNQPPPVRVPPIYTPGAPVPGPVITKPTDPYNPGSPIVTPPPGRAPLPAPATPKNPQLPPDWTGVTKTPIPTRAPTPGIAALTTLTGDPYGLTPTAEKYVAPTRTGRSKEIYDYLSGKTSTLPASTRKPIEAKPPASSSSPPPSSSPAPAPSGPPASSPEQQPVIDSIYTYVQSLGWGTPEADAKSLPLISKMAAEKGWTLTQLANATGFSEGALRVMFMNYGVTPPPSGQDSGTGAGGGVSGIGPGTGTGGGVGNNGLATGGYLKMAGGGLGSLGGYSDGGQLLRGPGDGVSDDIPATIGEHQPARLANNEFVIPARIVSELGNGSTEAGAKRLYQMMDRVQNARKKSIGKGNIAVDSKAYRHLPA